MASLGGTMLAVLAASCGGSPTSPTPVAPRRLPPKVVILSIDGLRADAVQEPFAPNIVSLARRGASSLRAQTVYPPMTLPSHASMLSGYLPPTHGLTWNDYQPLRGLIRVPTIFARARETGLRTVLVAGKNKFQHLDVPGTLDSYVEAYTDTDVISQAVAHAQAFDLMFVHLPQTDLTGHASGWMSSAYLRALQHADAEVARLVSALPPETVLIITADHGGQDRNHGYNRPVDMTIPWIIAGPGVVAGYEIAVPVSTLDTAATALHVLGLSLPAGAPGRPVIEVFLPNYAWLPVASERAA